MSVYMCEDCSVTDVKLWRQYQSFSVHLKCATCAAKAQDVDISDLDSDGLRFDTYYKDKNIPAEHLSKCRTDQIGWYIPACPTDDTFWGYTSVPNDAIKVWKALPNFKTAGE